MYFLQNNIAFAENKYNVEIAKLVLNIASSSKGVKGDIICVYGNDLIAEMLVGISNKAINVNKDSSLSKNDRCKLIYFGLDRTRTIRNDLEKFADKQTLTISLIEGFVDFGGIIELQTGRKNPEIITNSALLVKKNIQIGGQSFEYSK